MRCGNEECGKDISHLDGQRKFCSAKCQRKASGQRSIRIDADVYRLAVEEAARRGISVPALIELAVAPVLTKGRA